MKYLLFLTWIICLMIVWTLFAQLLTAASDIANILGCFVAAIFALISIQTSCFTNLKKKKKKSLFYLLL